MTEHAIRTAVEATGFTSSHELDTLSQRWSKAPDDLVKAVMGMLTVLSKLKNVELVARLNNRISGYGYNPRGRRRECFHIGVLRDGTAIIYQLGAGNVMPDFFTEHQETKPNARHGYLHQGNLHLIRSIQTVLEQSFKNLTQR